jgi:hypothetical protein
LYAHIKSVLQEGITLQGRTALSCPFYDSVADSVAVAADSVSSSSSSCQATIRDECIRACFQQNSTATDTDRNGNEATPHAAITTTMATIATTMAAITTTMATTAYKYSKRILSKFTYRLIIAPVTTLLLYAIQLYRCVFQTPSNWNWNYKYHPAQINTMTYKFRDKLILWKHGLKHALLVRGTTEEIDLELYERWSLTLALNLKNENENDDNDNESNDNENNDNENNLVDDDSSTTCMTKKKKWKKKYSTTKNKNNSNNNNNNNSNNQNNNNQNNNSNNNQNSSNSSSTTTSQMYTHVTRCPTPNCPYLWLTSKPFYNEKLKNELKYTTSSSSNNGTSGAGEGAAALASSTSSTSSIMQSAKTFFFYKTIHPNREQELLQQAGYTSEHWLHSTDVNLFETNVYNNNVNHTNESITNRHKDPNICKDGRAAHCPLCQHTFCNLCLQPWYARHAKKWQQFLSHTNTTCNTHFQKSVSKDEQHELETINNAIEARLCPGCGMRTNRIDGCNHMTCPCGFHWCYICGCRFNREHYRCTDANPLIRYDSASACIVS